MIGFFCCFVTLSVLNQPAQSQKIPCAISKNRFGNDKHQNILLLRLSKKRTVVRSDRFFSWLIFMITIQKVDEGQIYLRIEIKCRNHSSSTSLLVAAVYLLPIKLVSYCLFQTSCYCSDELNMNSFKRRILFSRRIEDGKKFALLKTILNDRNQRQLM